MNSSGRDPVPPPLPGDLPRYRLLTGADDRIFCERVSEALELGWALHGDPAITCHPDGSTQAAQALLWAATR